MSKIVVNLQTGEQTVEQYTADELAAIDAMSASVAQHKQTVVSMRQARLALLNSGLLSSVDASIAGMAGAPGDAARIEWEYAATVDRNSPLVAGLVVTLGLSESQLDALFESAALS